MIIIFKHIFFLSCQSQKNGQDVTHRCGATTYCVTPRCLELTPSAGAECSPNRDPKISGMGAAPSLSHLLLTHLDTRLHGLSQKRITPDSLLTGTRECVCVHTGVSQELCCQYKELKMPARNYIEKWRGMSSHCSWQETLISLFNVQITQHHLVASGHRNGCKTRLIKIINCIRNQPHADADRQLGTFAQCLIQIETFCPLKQDSIFTHNGQRCNSSNRFTHRNCYSRWQKINGLLSSKCRIFTRES